MKTLLSICFLCCSIISFSQDFERIIVPDFSDYVLPHYLDKEDGILYCSVKTYEDGTWLNYFAEYDVNADTIQVFYDFYKTSNVDWLSFVNFIEYGDYIYFEYGSKFYRKMKGGDNIETYLTNFDYSGFVDRYLIYHGDITNLTSFKIYDLETEQQIATFTARHADEYYLHDDNIYFFAQHNTHYIYKYDLTNNSLSTIYSITAQQDVYNADTQTQMLRLGDNLIYNMRDEDNTGMRISVNLNTDTLNTDFTFNFGNVGSLYQRDMFTINGMVYFYFDGAFYSSDGIQHPTVSDIALGTTSGFIDGLETDYLYFDGKVYGSHSSNEYGKEVHYTDGQSVFLLKDIIEGTEGGSYKHAYIHDDELYFYDRVSYVLYQSDGTSEGTIPLFEAPGTINFGRIHHYGDKIFFSVEFELNDVGMYVFKQTTVSISEHHSTVDDINLWYNTSTQSINFSSEEMPKSIKIFDLTGRRISAKTDLESKAVYLSPASGMYIAVLEFDNRIISRNIFIK